jgi:hypothetical protein
MGLLDSVLAHLADGTAADARSACLAAAEQDPDAVPWALASLADFWLGDFAEASLHAAEARARVTDSAACALALAVTALARA